MPQAVHWFKMADAKGYAQATLALGECYLFGSGTAQDYDLALQCLNTAASKDIAEAHYLLGSTYLGIKPGGDENTSFDPAKLAPEVSGNARLKKARGHLEKAWSRGQPLAGVLLAQMLLGGLGGDKDFKGGVEILDQAVQLPPADAYALRNLALIYSDEDVENLPSPAERRAAGVKANPERAKQLMKQAAELGLPEARQWCEEKGIKY
jgi:TPR repeat protein